MLNELYQLAIALEKAGITPHDWYKDLKPLPNATPKKPCYKILVGSDCSIVGIEPMGQGIASLLRKWQFGSLGYSFPGFNIQPLYCISGEGEKKLLEKWSRGKAQPDKKELQNWCINENGTAWNESMLNDCLGKIPRELKKRCGEIPNNFSAFKCLFERVESSWGDDGCNKFIQALKNYIWGKIEADENIVVLLPLLISQKSENISVFLDVPDWENFPVTHQDTIMFINKQLLLSECESCNETARQTKDAYGLNSSGCEEKLPETKLPFMGKVILRAMNSESRCQYRYGTIDAKSFNIGFDTRRRAKGALEWLCDVEREGETWGRSDVKELIFAYPTIVPESPLKLASCLGALKSDDTEARFIKYAEDVVDCLQGSETPLKNIELRVFSLRKMDNTSAKTKVVFHRNYSAQKLADAAKEWREGCENIPAILLKTWGVNKGEIVLSEVEIPFPLQIADCLNRVWRLDGTSKDEVKTIPKSAGIELLLDEIVAKRLTPHLLAVAIQNSKGLFSALGNSLIRNDILKFVGSDKQKLLMPSILGLLLWKLGIGKETYMSNTPFLVGRILKLADEIHALYCKEVRGNKMPSQLVGNSLMTAGLESPNQALSQLALRLKPYYGWAQTFRGKDNGGLAGYFIGLYGEAASQLAKHQIPVRFNDAERAQLLLGYLAANPKKIENLTVNINE